MMFLAEFLFEVVFQFLFEALAALGMRVLSTRTGRMTTAATVGFVGGLAWGAILAGRGLDTLPRTFWVAIALAVSALGAAVALRRSVRPSPEADAAFPGGLLPWRWAPQDWERFAVLNVLVAVGVLTGFWSRG
ncbi:MAG TPA: hypothetical protein VNA20_14970 [Frankiaceae bacterium]|nr:hypothetical protein [Frankiaceae bacterium]